MGGFNGQARRDRGAAISFAPIVVNAEAVMAEPGIAWNHAIGPRRAPAHAPREGPSSRGMSRTRGRVISALWRDPRPPTVPHDGCPVPRGSTRGLNPFTSRGILRNAR